MIRKGFEKEKLESVFSEIGNALQVPVSVYLLGGGAMVFRSQKSATKDLDLVFVSGKDYSAFIKTLPKLGFNKRAIRFISTEYKKMDAQSIWDEPNGFRLDLFVNIVCKALSLSKGMAKRSELLNTYGRLSVRMVSNADIILFKGITERSDDVDDIAFIFRSSDIDWDVILHECEEQSKVNPWYGPLSDKLYEIKEKYGIDAPIAKQIEELYYIGLLRAKVFELRKQGLNNEKIIAELRKDGFTEQEIKKALR